jgi:hypothetical protein
MKRLHVFDRRVRPRTSPKKSDWLVLGELGGFLLVIAAISYGLGYYVQYSFYAHFGVTPEEVGIDKTTGLLRLTPVIFTIGLVAIIVLASTMLCARVLFHYLPSEIRRRVPFWLFMPAVLFVLTMVGYETLVNGENPAYSVPGDDSSAQLFKSGMYLFGMWLFGVGVWYAARKSWGGKLAAILIAASLTMVTAYQLNVYVGDATESLTMYGRVTTTLPSVGIVVGLADVRWYDPARRPVALAASTPQQPVGDLAASVNTPPHLLFILNSSAGRYLLWDCATKRSFVVSDANVDVEHVSIPVGLGAARNRWYLRATGCTG